MILVADSGSTKTNWSVCEKGQLICQLLTSGTNPFFQTTEEITNEIGTSLWPTLSSFQIETVYFYGAGCAFTEQTDIIREAFKPFTNVPVEVYSDLMGAARSLCGKQSGIACILGTGSNSCYYDGLSIRQQISPLGFILGDEGSGAVLGKLLVADCLKHQLPENICKKFMEQYSLTPALLLDRIYKKPFPNRFLAHLSGFLLENIEEQAIYNLVYNSFRSFFIRNVMQYEGYKNCPIHFTGSIAYYYRKVLLDAASSLQLTLGKIEKEPMPGLISFHS